MTKLKMPEFDMCHLFAVCDGHGTSGQRIADYVKNKFPSILQENLLDYLIAGRSPRTRQKLGCTYPDKTDIITAIKETFVNINEQLSWMTLDIKYSGSTFTGVLFFGDKLYVINLGDSRTILVRQGSDNTKFVQDDFAIKQLSKDHTPENEKEKHRVLNAGGRIDSFRDRHDNPMGPKRVWLMDYDEPGLAMTRSFGDTIAHSVGCSDTPEILEYSIQMRDRFLVIATDGIWQWLSNQDVGKTIYPFYLKNDAEGAAIQIMKEANSAWLEHSEGIVDDMTCIIVFL